MDQHDLWPQVLSRLASHGSLSADEAAEVMRRIMTGDATPGQIGGFLMALRTKGETVDEVEGLVRTMLEFATPGPHRPSPSSTSSAPAATEAGPSTSRRSRRSWSRAPVSPSPSTGTAPPARDCGSADVLEALGVRIDLDAAGVERCLTEVRIAFLFAPAFHPSMAHAGPVRRELRVPTVFNFLGPLCNPAQPFAQAVGVSDARMLPLMAEVLARRRVRAKLFRGQDGLDELTTTGISAVYDVRDGEVRETHVDPADLGLSRAERGRPTGRGCEDEAASIARAILEGGRGPRRDVVLLNAGAALEVAGVASSIAEGMTLAARSIDDGAAAAVLERWIAVSREGVARGR